MLLRKSDGKKWFSLAMVENFAISFNAGGGGSWQLDLNYGTTETVATFASEAAAETALAKLIVALQNVATVNQFVLTADGSKAYNVANSEFLTVASNGDGTYSVRIESQVVSSGYASEAAAITALDALAASLGGIDVNALVT